MLKPNCLKTSIIFILIIALTAGCSLLPKEDEPLKPPLVQPVRVNDVLSEVEIGSITVEVTGSGSLESTNQAHHQLTASGDRVKEVLVRSGSVVEAGDPLILFEDDGVDRDVLRREIEREKKQLALDEAKRTNDQRRIRIASLELELAQMELDIILEKQESLQIRAQMSGVVTFVASLNPGDFVEAYRSLVIISDPNQLRLAYSTSNASSLSNVKVGMSAELTHKNNELTGKVVQTPSSAPFTEDNRLREQYSKTLFIEMDQLPEEAEMGNQVNVRIILAHKEDVIIIPKSGLRSTFGRNYVQVLEDERRRELDIELGLESTTMVEVVNGLEPGQMIVLK